MTAIVFNCAYNGLSIIQELGRRGVDVHALDSFRNVGTMSRYATYHNCPNPMVDERGFVDFLLDLAPEFDDTPVLIPTNDHWAAAIAHHRDRLAEHYHPCVVDGETIDILLNKDTFGCWALERGYPVPRSWTAERFDDVPDDAFPVAAKPSDATSVPDMMFDSKIALVYNKLFGDGDESTMTAQEREVAERLSEIRLEVLRSRAELEQFTTEYADVLEHFVVQEYVRGMSDQMYTVGVYADRGNVKGVFTGRKVRGYPPDIGDCKVGQVESVPAHVVNTVESMCEELKYHGIAEFEFKKDANTGEFYLIEVNPRSWSWIGITPACDVSLPWIAYADLSGGSEVTFERCTKEDGSVIWVKAFEDALNCLYFYRRSHRKWATGPKTWWNSIDADSLVVAELSMDDPAPTCYSIVLLFRRLGTAAKNGLVNRL